MKRFAVLFGMLAVVVACSPSFATAPQVRALPDVRLGIFEGDSGLPEQALSAYDVIDYFTDSDNEATELTVSILDRDWFDAPGAEDPPEGDPAIIDFDGFDFLSGVDSFPVDVYPSANPGWTQYTVLVEEPEEEEPGKGADISQVAIAKTSTFSLNAPTISDGLLLQAGGLVASSRQFTYVYMGGDGALYRLDEALVPTDTDVDWTLYLNEVISDDLLLNYDANGRWIGLAYNLLADGDSVTEAELVYGIDADGALSIETLTPGGQVMGGPWVIGILATNQEDPNDSDGSRVLIGSAMVPYVSEENATLGTSVTFDDLDLGPIPAAGNWFINTDEGDGTNPFYRRPRPLVGEPPAPWEVQIRENSGWTNIMTGVDVIFEAVPLEIVDLEADTDLPLEAQIFGPDTAHIAGGRGIKATLEAPPEGPVGPRGMNPEWIQLDGFRLQSRHFTGIQPDDVITFALNVATDAQSATDLPNFLIYITSGFGGSMAGQHFTYQPGVYALAGAEEVGDPPELVESDSYEVSQVNVPMAAQGWHTISTNYSPGSTRVWMDQNNDGVMDEADIDLLRPYAELLGWDAANELSAIQVGLRCNTHRLAENDVTVWLDNFRVFRSAYALDLALGPEELFETADSADPVVYNLGVRRGILATGSIDGTFESIEEMTPENFSDIGFISAYGWGGAMPHSPFMAFLEPTRYGEEGALQIGAYDHTMNANSSQCLSISISGDSGVSGNYGDLNAFRTQVLTTFVDAQGSGLYAIEAFMSKAYPVNQVAAERHPDVRLILNEVAPNHEGANSGVIFQWGGLPESVGGAPPGNWQRAVAEMYIPNAQYVRGMIQVISSIWDDANDYSVPILVDDLKIYKVDDPVIFFDADLYGG